MFALGVELMIYGLVGVFTVLLLFYVVIVSLVKVFPDKQKQAGGK